MTGNVKIKKDMKGWLTGTGCSIEFIESLQFRVLWLTPESHIPTIVLLGSSIALEGSGLILA